MPAASEAEAVLALLPSPALMIDAAGRIAAANAAIARCFGCEPRQLLGTPLIAAAVDPTALTTFLRQRDGGPREFGFQRRDGGESRLDLVAREAPSSGTVLVCAWDVTERRVRDQRVQEDIDRFRDMIGAGTGWFYEIDAMLTRQRVFRRSAKDGVLAMAEQETKWPEDTMDSTFDPEGFAETVRKWRAREPSRNYVFRVPPQQLGGREVYLLGSSIPFFDKNGVYQGRRGVSIDVTRQVLAERGLRRAQQHLEHAQRLAEIGSSEFDFASGTETWSDQMFRIVGIERQPLAPGKIHLLDFVHAEDRGRLEYAIAAARAGNKPRVGELRLVRPDGEIRTILSETDIEADKSGKPMRMLAIFKDVTEQRAAEQRQREMEQQLQQAQKLEALGTLAGGVAHELNNTLVPVLGLAKITIKRLPEGSRERSNLITILQAGEKARDLVERIVAFSRKEMPTRIAVDMAALTRSTVELLRASLPQTISLAEHIEAVPPVMGDPGQLPQILINLVVNAAQATPDQTGTVTIEVAPADGERLPQFPDRAPGRAIRLSVIDRGCGMDRATLGRIFEPFFTTKEVGVGSGLGLSVVHGIVTQHGGHIAVESAPGRGTRFDVYLPAVAVEAAAEQEIAAS